MRSDDQVSFRSCTMRRKKDETTNFTIHGALSIGWYINEYDRLMRWFLCSVPLYVISITLFPVNRIIT